MAMVMMMMMAMVMVMVVMVTYRYCCILLLSKRQTSTIHAACKHGPRKLQDHIDLDLSQLDCSKRVHSIVAFSLHLLLSLRTNSSAIKTQRLEMARNETTRSHTNRRNVYAEKSRSKITSSLTVLTPLGGSRPLEQTPLRTYVLLVVLVLV